MPTYLHSSGFCGWAVTKHIILQALNCLWAQSCWYHGLHETPVALASGYLLTWLPSHPYLSAPFLKALKQTLGCMWSQLKTGQSALLKRGIPSKYNHNTTVKAKLVTTSLRTANSAQCSWCPADSLPSPLHPPPPSYPSTPVSLASYVFIIFLLNDDWKLPLVYLVGGCLALWGPCPWFSYCLSYHSSFATQPQSLVLWKCPLTGILRQCFFSQTGSQVNMI